MFAYIFNSLTFRRSTISVSRLTAIARQSSLERSESDNFEQDSGSQTCQPYSDTVRKEIDALTKTHDVKTITRQDASEHLFPRGCHLFLPASAPDSGTSPEIGSVCIDLTPRPVMSAGPLMDLLVRTNVGHYVDFRPVDGLYQHFPNPIGTQRTPATRSAVFTHKLVSAIEKRLLTRFLKAVLAEKENGTESSRTNNMPDRPEPYGEASFSEAMSNARLTDQLQKFVHHSVLFSATGQNVTESDGRSRIHRFHDGMVRFGTRSPFLYPNYGGGEIAQAFCRLCAVHGGIQVLRRGAAAVAIERPRVENDSIGNLSTHGVSVVSTESDVVQAKQVFISNAFGLEGINASEANSSDSKQVSADCGWPVWRFAGVVDGSVMSKEEPSRIMICFPRGSGGNQWSDVWVRQVDSSVGVCGQGQCVLYAETIEKNGTEQDVLACVQTLVDWSNIMSDSHALFKGDCDTQEEASSKQTNDSDCVAKYKPNLLWGLTYERIGDIGPVAASIDRIEFVSPSEVEIDADSIVVEAERCFRLMFGKEAPFLPQLSSDHDGTGKVDEESQHSANDNANREEEYEDEN